MNIKRFFEYTPTLDLNAAHIGINKWDWICIDSLNEKSAQRKMQDHRFDVLPVQTGKGITESYFRTKLRNNFSKIAHYEIKEEDLIYYRLSFEDLIRKFDQENRFFYFLTNHKEVFGLVSLVNLNSQPVYSYLFQLVSSIEKNISEKLEQLIDQAGIINAFENSSDSLNQSIVKDFNKAIKEGKENTIFQHMYLQNIGYILDKFSHQLDENLIKLKPYRPNFLPNGLYNRIRNNVMHPVRPIYDGQVSISEINQFLTDYQEIIDILSDK